MATGWGNPDPYSSRSKFHYFGEDGRSLCGKWGSLGRLTLEEGKDEHCDNCAECKRRKLKANAASLSDKDDKVVKDVVLP